MGKGRMVIVGYDGAGERILRRKRHDKAPERAQREDRVVRATFRQRFAQDSIEAEDLRIERALGLRVR